MQSATRADNIVARCATFPAAWAWCFYLRPPIIHIDDDAAVFQFRVSVARRQRSGLPAYLFKFRIAIGFVHDILRVHCGKLVAIGYPRVSVLAPLVPYLA